MCGRTTVALDSSPIKHSISSKHYMLKLIIVMIKRMLKSIKDFDLIKQSIKQLFFSLSAKIDELAMMKQEL